MPVTIAPIHASSGVSKSNVSPGHESSVVSSSSISSHAFDRKPLADACSFVACHKSSKMTRLFKTSSPQCPAQAAQVSFQPSGNDKSDSIIINSEGSSSGSNQGAQQIRFWCPKPSRSAIFNKLAAHRHTPPPQVLRKRECFFSSSQISQEEEDDEDEEDDNEYYGSSSDDDEDDYNDNDDMDGLVSRLNTSCSTYDEDDDCIFSSD